MSIFIMEDSRRDMETKCSSALDIQYRKPRHFGGSAYIGLLEQGLHLEGSTRKNDLLTCLVFAIEAKEFIEQPGNTRELCSLLRRSAGSSDLSIQSRNGHWSLLGNISQTKFKLVPEFSQLSSSVFSPYFSANLGLDIFFEGREEDRYVTNMVGLTCNQQVKKNLRLKWMFVDLKTMKKNQSI